MERLLGGKLRETGPLSPPQEQEVVQRMHPDFITFLHGIEYFYLGNGDIQAAIQYCPLDRQGSFFGVTLMDPEIFCRKWSTFLYHPERGFANTRLGLTINEARKTSDAKAGVYQGVKGFQLIPENFVALEWRERDGVPQVVLVWKAADLTIEETFSVPTTGSLLFRRVSVTNRGEVPVDASLSLSLYPNFGLFDRIGVDERTKVASARGLATMKLLSLDSRATVSGRYDVRVPLGDIRKGDSAGTTYVYALKGDERLLKSTTLKRLEEKSRLHWSRTTSLSTSERLLDHLFRVSKAGLPSVVARSGRMDGGQWMYNMEWLFDQVLASEALLRLGLVEQARTMLEKNLREGIGPDGRTVESSRWFGYDYTELNQNGTLLYGVWAYYCWTGDLALVRKYWTKIVLCGDFPLLDRFRDGKSGLVHNKREFWERSDTHGVQDGFELGYQFWVAFGLEKGAILADLVKDPRVAARWRRAAAEMKRSMFEDPSYRLIEEGHLIKRRTVDGTWQRYFHPPDRSKLPPGSPLSLEKDPCADPDTITVLPIMYEMIDPRGELSRKTLDYLEQLWNQRWVIGGYPRYNVTGEDNPPAPWSIATGLMARAHAVAGNDETVWRILEWFGTIHGGHSGAWFERYGQSITPPMPPVGVVSWTWYELIGLCVRDLAGFQPETDHVMIHPHLLKGVTAMRLSVPVRGGLVYLEVYRSEGGPRALIQGKEQPLEDGRIIIPFPRKGKLLNVKLYL